MSNLFVYFLGMEEFINVELNADTEDFILKTIESFLGKRESIEIINDYSQLKNSILDWLINKEINLTQLKPFCNKIRAQLRTRSIESQRCLVIYLKKPMEGEPLLFIIHTNEKMEGLSENFQEIIKVGLAPSKILRVMQFSRQSENSIQLRYRERYKTNFIWELFGIVSDRFDVSGTISLKGSLDSVLNFTITVSPSDFLSELEIGNIRFIDNKRMNLLRKYDCQLDEIRYKSESFTPSQKKISEFIQKLKSQYDKFETQIETFNMEYNSKKIQYGLKRDYSLNHFLESKLFPDPNTLHFKEYLEYISIFINSEEKERIKKVCDPWGMFLAVDELINLDDGFCRTIAYEIVSGGLRNARLLNVPYSNTPIRIGNYYWHNDFKLDEKIQKIVQFLQAEFEKSDSERKRRIILLAILFILNNNTEFLSAQKFLLQVIQRVFDPNGIFISKDINENKYFEFKRGDILDTGISLDERMRSLSRAIQPNLNNNGLSILIVGYDEDQNEITPITFNHYRTEIQQQIIKGIKTELRNPTLQLKIFLCGNEEGLLLLIAVNPDFNSQVNLGNIFD